MSNFLTRRYFALAFIILVSNTVMTGQEDQNISTPSLADSTLVSDAEQVDTQFQKISLDGIPAYRNIATGDIVSEMHYLRSLPGADSISTPIITQDYWLHDKVNPYKDVVLPTPFMVEFEQDSFTMPIDGKVVVTSRFGRRRRGPHRGIDIDLVTGDFVRTVLPGKVRFVGYSRGHGKTIVVRHANEIETVYAHLSAYNVRVNDEVIEGQIIGRGGNTGNSRGSHLHLEVRYKGTCIHPEYVFDFDNETIRGKQLWVSNGYKNPKSHSSYRKSKITCLHTHDEAIAYQEREPKYYRVRRGDTLSQIARKHNLYLKELCTMNGISTRKVLQIGKLLRIR